MLAATSTEPDYETMIPFQSHAPGYWPAEAMEKWDDYKWQLRNRINSLNELEELPDSQTDHPAYGGKPR